MSFPNSLCPVASPGAVLTDHTDPVSPPTSDDQQEILQLLGITIVYYRRQRKLTQEELAVAAHMNRTYLGEIERGRRNVSVVNLINLARALQVSPSLLLRPFDLPSSPGFSPNVHT